MRWKEIPCGTRDALLERKKSGELVESIAGELGMRPTTLDRRLRDWAQATDAQVSRVRKPKDLPKRWDEPPIFSGNAVVTGDYHVPYVDYKFTDKMLNLASTNLDRPRRLVIAGDLFNMGTLSRFPHSNRHKSSLLKEFGRARTLLSDMADVFDSIEALLGNHELRLVYQLFGEISPREFELLVECDRVRFYEYGQAIIKSPTGEWRATHQRNYSVTAQSVGVKLAHKFQQHIITHHQHKVSFGFDSSGNHVVIDNGCMADPGYFDYSNMIDTTSPLMTQSFVILKDGVARLYPNHPAVDFV